MELIKAMLVKCSVRLFRRYPRRNSSVYSEADLIVDHFASQSLLDGTMIDVGAQFGESLNPYRRLGWNIYAFEPDPNPAKQNSLARLKNSIVHISRFAVSDQDDLEVPIYASDESTGVTSLAPFLESHIPVEKVKTTTLRSYLKPKAISKVDFLKIDTEGFDFHALKGFPWDRPSLHPDVILCEFEDKKSLPLGYRWDEMAEFLQAQGYTVWVSEWYPIEKYGVEHRFRKLGRFPMDLEESSGWGNLISIKQGSKAEGLNARLMNLSVK